MRIITTLTMTAALIGGAVLFADRAASAAPIANGASAMSQQASQLADTLHVQVQRGPRGVRVGPGRRGPRGGPGPRGGWRGGGNRGGAVAAGIAGGLMLGIIAAEQARAASQQDALIAQCARRFRSYDPQTQTYVGRGGRIYSCP